MPMKWIMIGLSALAMSGPAWAGDKASSGTVQTGDGASQRQDQTVKILTPSEMEKMSRSEQRKRLKAVEEARQANTGH